MKTLTERIINYMSAHHPHDYLDCEEYVKQDTDSLMKTDPTPLVYFLLEDYLGEGENDALPLIVELLCAMKDGD